MTNLWVLFVGLIPVSVVVGASLRANDLLDNILRAKRQQTNKPEQDEYDEEAAQMVDAVLEVADAICDSVSKYFFRNGRVDNNANIRQTLERSLINRPYETERDTRSRLYIPKQDGYYSEDPSYFDNVDNRLRDYSKIYVVLNPDLVQNNLNKHSPSNLISRLVADSSRSREPLVELSQGVPTFELSRRRRESREDRDDDRYNEERRPKRGGNGGGGGGGGNNFGFHTAIPYIRHRGDVYE